MQPKSREEVLREHASLDYAWLCATRRPSLPGNKKLFDRFPTRTSILIYRDEMLAQCPPEKTDASDCRLKEEYTISTPAQESKYRYRY